MRKFSGMMPQRNSGARRNSKDRRDSKEVGGSSSSSDGVAVGDDVRRLSLVGSTLNIPLGDTEAEQRARAARQLYAMDVIDIPPAQFEEAAGRVLDTMDEAAIEKIKKFLMMAKPTLNTTFLKELAKEVGVDGGAGALQERKDELCVIVGTLIASREEASDPEAQAMEAALIKEQAENFSKISSFKPPIKNPKPEGAPAPASVLEGVAEALGMRKSGPDLEKACRDVLAESDVASVKKFLGMGTLTSTFMNKVGALIGEDEYEIRARKPQLMEIVAMLVGSERGRQA